MILQYFLNTYTNLGLNNNPRANRGLYKDYFKRGDTTYIKRENIEYFHAKKTEFFTQYIETGRLLVKYVDFNSEELASAIEVVSTEEPALGGVFIDYFQLIDLPENKAKGKSRRQERKDVCIQLKNVANDTGLPICLAAQFNREVTNLERLHPTKISEAGDIERVVNTLVGLWNNEKPIVLKGITEAEAEAINYKKDTAKNKGNYSESSIYAEILKSRDLSTGGYSFLTLNGKTGKITNPEQGSEYKNRYIRDLLRLESDAGAIITEEAINKRAELLGWKGALLEEALEYFRNRGEKPADNTENNSGLKFE